MQFPYDTPVRIVAKPRGGSFFAGWSGSTTGDVNPLPMLVRDANAIISASFLPLPAGRVALTVVPDGNGKVSVGPRANLFSIGQTVTNTALPDPGQEFLGWTGDAQGLENPLVLAMDQSKNITARFTKRPHLDLQVSGNDGVLLTLTGEFTGAYHVLRSSDLVGWSEILTLTNAYGEAQMMNPSSDPGLCFKAVGMALIQRIATAVPTVVNGFVVAVTVTDGGDGYTTAPQVTITGGGGAGAAATAIVLEGKVDKVIVVNAGSGYTETPTVLIAPPSP
jgi:Divergent InlB B-repeat domain